MILESTQTAGKEEDALGEERAQASLRRPAVLLGSKIISVSVTRVKQERKSAERSEKPRAAEKAERSGKPPAGGGVCGGERPAKVK